ncbi:MAG TPA: glycosyltransferase [Solirubrobacterales bacterium]|nr:glycosyltransferase [Solirubrobacterales bacterium]
MQFDLVRVSVVVPTQGRPEALARCVAALEAQTAAVEVVIIEDAEGRGPAWARNEGVRRARGEVVCFTDDDCEPEAGWVEALVAPLLAEEAEVATGPVRMGDGATTADRAWEAIVNYLQVRATAPGSASPGFAVTANLAARRSLLERIPFDESFPVAAGEDRDWGERAAQAGSGPVFVPAATVIHQSGMSARGFLRQQYRYGRGAARYRASGNGRRPGSPSFYVGLIRAAFRAGPAPGLLVTAAQAATLAGVIRETARERLYDDLSRSRR